jgi:peroxiredoxin family protein
MTNQQPLGLVVLSGEYARVHYALMMASAAAAIDRPVTLFFTMDAAVTVQAGEGWRALAGSGRDDDLKARNVADIETLLEACVAMEVTFMVCEAGLKALDMPPEGLREDLGVEVTGLVTFYQAVGDGQIATL